MATTEQQSLRDLLARTDIMVLSTHGPDGPWATPVQYSVQGRLELTFLSRPETRHVEDIQANPAVAAAIFSADGDAGGNLGLQLTGTAHLGPHPGPENWWRITVVPDEAWVFDSREGRRRRRVDLASLA